MEQPWSEQLHELLKQAQLKRTAGDRAGAVKLLEAAIDPVKAFGTWRYARGTLALELGDVATAIAQFEQAAEREPAVPEFRANLGAALLEQGKQGDPAALQRALEVLQQCASEEPRLPHSHTNLGMAKLVLDDPNGALACFDRALAMDPDHVPSLYNRGAVLKGLGRLPESLAMIERVLKLDPKFQPAIDAKKKLAALLTS
ncbi:MAG: sulfotransferase [Myxococcaceae bacterium]|nr:sulfotransferase [Myxococcaceae bacterium]